MHKVAVIVGSLRRESLNLKFAKALARLAEGRLAFAIVDLAGVPIYNDDLWADPPAAVLRLKRDIEAADAVLFVTPEYNRSIPAVVKNVIDWASRPPGKSAWTGKPAAIVGTSPGALGTAVAQAQLRSIAVACGMSLLSRPEVYLTSKPGLISETFEVTDEKSRAFLAGFVEMFAAHVARMTAPA